MLEFNAEKMRDTLRANLSNKDEIIALADRLSAEGYSNVFFIGVGGTYTYAMIMDANLRAHTSMPYYYEHAADFNTMGNRRFSKNSIVVTASATGDTPEVNAAVKSAVEAGARVVAFVETENTPIANAATYFVHGASLYRYYLFFFRLAYNRGDYPEFDKMVENLLLLPEILPNVAASADAKCDAYAREHRDDALQYLIGSGNIWGSTYSYAMCIMEEMQWMRTKSVSAGDFFHGTLEVIDRDTNVVLFMGEDGSRPQAERAKRFLNRVCAHLTIFDLKEYELAGLDEQYRGLFSPMVFRAITSRISAYLEEYGKHPMEIRRYYRKLTY